MNSIRLNQAVYSRLHAKLVCKLIVREDLKVYPTISAILQLVEEVYHCKVMGLGLAGVELDFDSASAYTMFALEYSEYLTPIPTTLPT